MVPPHPAPADLSCDLLVAGSGSAGLTAALAAAHAGLSVIIAEKAAVLGGTTALSGAAIWAPANHRAAAAGIADSPAEAFAYMKAAAPPGWEAQEAPLWARMAQEAGPMLRFVEEATPLRFALTTQADPLTDLPGAKARGRMVSPLPLPRRLAGPHAHRLRPPLFPHLYSFQEAMAGDLYHYPWHMAWRHAPALLWRLATGRRGKGTALVTGLLAGCQRLGCRILTEAPLTRLLTEAGRVTGAEIWRDGQVLTIRVARGVVLASGGFEWDEARLAAHFPGPLGLRASPRSNSGDAHRLAEAAGAALAHMDQANFAPAIPTRYESRPHGLSVYFHQEPGAILVNRRGRRFADELTFNLGEALLAQEGPLWLIADRRLLRESPVLRWYLRRHGKGWYHEAPDLCRLAAAAGLPIAALSEAVQRYNAFCARGADEDFGRAATGPVGMRAVSEAPFLALPFNPSFMSTKGGPRTDSTGRVLRPDGSAIPGLFCAGVAMANPIGTRAVGAGTTIGPNMIWGYVCGLTAAGKLWEAADVSR